MSELQPGQSLGRYELLVRIGRGGMATVWVARERSASGAHRLVAVKAMLPELAQHSQFRSMFLGEVQLIQSISHPHVVQVFEVSEDHGILYMAMEWVEGDSLRHLIRAARSRGAIPSEIAVRITADAAAGLHAAHELRDWSGELRGVVHCDVSPHNILVGMDGKAKIVDFGIANALGRIEPSNDGERIKGKLSYMSPEQARGEHIDRRTDVFALGIVLFELTTGEQLFKGRDAAHTLELVRHGTIPRPSTLNPRYPDRLEELVLRALTRDADHRYQTAAEFEEALTQYLYEDRTLVSHAAVAQLMHRIIGKRLEKRRNVLADVIEAVDRFGPPEPGTAQRSLPPLSDMMPLSSDPFNVTAVSLSGEGALGIAARLESHTMAALPLVSAPPSTGTLPMRWVVVLGLGIALAAAGGTLFALRSRLTKVEYLTVKHEGAPDARKDDSGARQRPSGEAAPHEEAVDPDSLPLAASDQAAREASLGPARSGRASRRARAAGARAAEEESTTDRSAPERTGAPGNTGVEESRTTANGIERARASVSLSSAAMAARKCRSTGEFPRGDGRAKVTFAPDGSVVVVGMSRPFEGTAVGNCVAAHFRGARVPAFTGEPTTITYPFRIPD